MEVLPFIHFFCLIVYVYLSIYIFLKNPASQLNRVCALFSLCFGVWNVGDIVIHSASVSKETVSFFVNINCIGWSSFASIFLWFVAIFTDKKKLINSKRFYIVIFFFPVFFIFFQWKGLLIVDWVRQPWGWASVWTDNNFDYLYYAYYLSFMIMALVMLSRFIRFTKAPLKKKQARIILISTIIPLLAGTFTDVVLPKITILTIPDLANIFTLIRVTGLVMSIVRYNFFYLTPAMVEFTTVFNQTLEHGRSVVYRKNFDLDEYEYMGEGIKAIAASGYSNEPVIADYTKYGFSAAATKPFDIEELHETLSRLLNK